MRSWRLSPRVRLACAVWLACATALASGAAAAAGPEPAALLPPAQVSPQAQVAPAQVAVPAEVGPPRRTPAPDIELPKTELPDALKDDESESVGFALFRTLVVLGVVLMIVWLSLNFGLRRLMGLKGPLGGPAVVTVLERVPLDQKRALFVVKAAGEYLLLGGGDGALGLVAKLNAEEVEKLLQRPAGGAIASPFLARLLSKKN